MTHQTFEQLQALTGCDDHLQFVVKVIEKVHISESVRVGYEQQIQRIQRRRTDPNFYLAVIGEFSSGKSTFINALLRDDLLKTSALIATSAATKLRYGDNINVEVIFQGSKAGTLKTKNNAKQITIPWLAGVNGIDIRQFIHIVTSKDEVAKDVVDLTITHPAPFLANGIVIIDTPGTNAINPQHADITRQVVENEADAALAKEILGIDYNLNQMQLADIQRYRLLTRVGSSAAMIGSYVLGGPAAMAIALSLGTGLFSEKLLNDNLEDQRRTIAKELENSVERAIEEYCGRVSPLTDILQLLNKGR